ncbi:hypothetical protein DMB42_01230 [Nonomuraea sp. WAC 01424]|nr:hypothetical protein DMB42_01230 [Nonomuraea sp. WAC 01424]
MGYAEDLGPRLFQLAVPALRDRFSDVRALPYPMTTSSQIVALGDGRLDIGFWWNAETGPGLDSLLVTREPLVVAVAARHSLAAESAVDPVRLSGLPLIVVERDVNPCTPSAYRTSPRQRTSHRPPAEAYPWAACSGADVTGERSEAGVRSGPGRLRRSPPSPRGSVWSRRTGRASARPVRSPGSPPRACSPQGGWRDPPR